MKNLADNKYKEGTEIYSLTYPNLKLVIRRYIGRIYYCGFVDDPDRKELALFEREISTRTDIISSK